MTWTARDYLRDANAQTDECNEAWRDEIATQRNADHHLIDDDRPTRAECEADDGGGPWSLLPDPWGDVGPVHHPTRFDLPMSAEPPF